MLNASGEIVSRKVMADAFGDETFSIGGAAIDRVSIDVAKDASGDIGSVAISLRSTEELQPGSVAAGVRLAANDQNGQTLRTAETVASLTDPFTATATMSSKEWSSFIDGATSISIAATPSLRASAWGAAVPVLPAPAWATATLPVSSATYPIEVRESISDLTSHIAAIPSSSQSSLTLYEVPDLALLGTPDAPDDPSRLLVHSPFQALPFSDSTTHLIYVRARWYDPGTGTWLTPDPMGYRDSSNLYAFAGGDPVNGRDGTGLLCDKRAGESRWSLGYLKRCGEDVFNVQQAFSEGVLLHPVKTTGRAIGGVSGTNQMILQTGLGIVGTVLDQQLAIGGDVRAAMRQGQRALTIENKLRHPIDTVAEEHRRAAEKILAAEEGGHWFEASVQAAEIGSADAAAAAGAVEGAIGITRLTTGAAHRLGVLNVGVNNPVPSRLARVVPADVVHTTKNLARASDADAFVTAADRLAGLSSSEEIATALRLVDREGKLLPGPFGVIEFDTPARGIASPVFRNNPGFLGKGLTGGGLPEFVVPNLLIEELQNVIIRLVP